MKRALAGIAIACLLASAASAQQPCGAPGLTVTVTPSVAAPGQVITVTLTNGTAQTWHLSSSCVYGGVFASNCAGTPVAIFGCAAVITPLPPGASKSQTWDQKDTGGGQVPFGTYAFSVKAFDAASNPFFCCPTVDIVPACSSPPSNYGSGDAGSGGFVPHVSTAGGLPAVGNLAFQLTVDSGLGGAPAVLFVGALAGQIQAPWGTLLINPNPVLLQVPLVLGGPSGAPGQGNLVLPAPIPSNPLLVGLAGYVQVLVADGGSSGGISHTEGLQITICP